VLERTTNVKQELLGISERVVALALHVNTKTVLLALCVLMAPKPSSAQDGPADVYRAAVDAFGRGDAESYFGTFEPELRCFYGSRGVSLAHVRHRRVAFVAANRRRARTHRLTVETLDVVHRGDEGVVLVDRGRFDGRSHEKAVLMVRRGEGWRIAAEGGFRSACYRELMRRQTVTGTDPLGSEEGIWRALRRVREVGGVEGTLDLVDHGRGVLRLNRATDGEWRASCVTPIVGPPADVPRESFRCNDSLTRCVLSGRQVHRFAERDGRRQLVGVVAYPGEVPPREPAEAARLLAARDRICELHDRSFLADPALARDDLWVFRADLGGEVTARHLCGRPAVRQGRRAIARMSRTPLGCSELHCAYATDSHGDPHVHARREDGELRLWIDATRWVAGTNVPTRLWRRARRRRCSSPARRAR
jgi:hypothetical protein